MPRQKQKGRMRSVGDSHAADKELVLQRPHKVAVDVHAAVNRLEDPREMPAHIVDARGVVDKAVLGIEWMDCDALHNTIDCPIRTWRVRRVSNAN